jgi:hypothetical protein
MNASRLIWASARGLRCLGLAVIVLPAAIACGAGASNSHAQPPPSEVESSLNGQAAGSPAPEGGGPSVVSPPGQDEGDLSPIYYGAGGGEGTPPGVIKSFHGNGSRNSAPFPVNVSVVTVDYSYDCSSVGGSGSFAADMISVSPQYDDQLIANAVGARYWARLALYPQNAGSNYRLRVSSDCAWSITVTSG